MEAPRASARGSTKHLTVLQKQEIIRACNTKAVSHQKTLASLYGVTPSTISKILAQSKEILAVHPLVAEHTFHLPPVHQGDDKSWLSRLLPRRALGLEELRRLFNAITASKQEGAMDQKCKQALATFLSEGLTTFEAVTAAEEARRGRWTTKQASVLNTMKLFFRSDEELPSRKRKLEPEAAIGLYGPSSSNRDRPRESRLPSEMHLSPAAVGVPDQTQQHPRQLTWCQGATPLLAELQKQHPASAEALADSFLFGDRIYFQVLDFPPLGIERYGYGFCLGMSEFCFQDKARPGEGLLLLVQSSQVPGSGILECRGHFKDTSREAIMVAFSYVRSHMGELRRALGLPDNAPPGDDLLSSDKDTVIRCSPVNVTKKGVSLGAAALLCFVSEALGVQIRWDVAVTGEVDLRGGLFRVDGLESKVQAAREAGLKLVLCPEESARLYHAQQEASRSKEQQEEGSRDHEPDSVKVVGVKTVIEMVKWAFTPDKDEADQPEEEEPKPQPPTSRGDDDDDDDDDDTTDDDDDDDDDMFEPVPELSPELVVDDKCFLGMARAFTYCFFESSAKLAVGTTMEIECLAVPGRGRLTVTGNAKAQHYACCKDAVWWLWQYGPQFEGKGLGTPRIKPSAILQHYDVHFHFSEPTAVKDEMHVGAAIYLSAISMLMGWDMADQLAILGDVTPSGEFLDMTHVGRLDVELVAQARIRKMIVPINQERNFVRLEAERAGSVRYKGTDNMWHAIRLAFRAAATLMDRQKRREAARGRD